MSRWLVLPLVVIPCFAAAATASAARDRDRDGLADRWEKRYHLSLVKKSATRDPDRDGLRNLGEHRHRTNPRRKDTDGDGLRDGAEVRRHRTHPRRRDTDRDGHSDRVEVRKGTNPRDRGSHPPGSATPGFPDASNTGVPPGTTLTPYRGPRTISTPGTVVDAKTMGCIRVTVPGVVIRRSKVSCAGSYAVYSADGDYAGTPLLIEDSEVDCRGTGGHALGEANITARRVDIRGCENGGDINQSFTIEDSYIHDLYNGRSAHTDGLQFAYGHFKNGRIVRGSLNVTIRHNTIFGMGADGSFGTSAIISNRGGDRNVLIQGNLLAGGAYAIYCEQGATGSNYRVLDNAFSRRFRGSVGFYGPSTGCSDERQSGNYIYETGQPISLR